MAVLLRVPEVEDPDFLAEMSYAEGACLRLSGSADGTTTQAFGEMFAKLHAELCERNARVLTLDMQHVDYMSARCFRQLLAWVNRVQELASDQRYKIRLRGNASLAWQKHSLAALSCFDTELISLEVA
jgi:hypothetical protein